MNMVYPYKERRCCFVDANTWYWELWVSYPYELSMRARILLDTLAELMCNVQFSEDRFVAMSTLIDGGRDLGLINGKERAYLQQELGPNM
jgi:hypothetical protein